MTDNETRPQCRAQLSYEGLKYRCDRPENHEGGHVDRDNDTWDITYVDEPGVSPQAIFVDIRCGRPKGQLTALTARVGLLEAAWTVGGETLSERLDRVIHGVTERHRFVAMRVEELEGVFMALREDATRMHSRITGLEARLTPAQPPENEAVLIDPVELGKLLEAQEKLSKLEAAGVDNWDGYEDALNGVKY